MREALVEGRKALEKCGPNPPVGCVLVKNGEIISRGHTNEPGELHAEAMALNQIEAPLNGVTAFVTLEPCSYYGRTPSCAKALVNRRIKEVYVGMIDPHPRNRGAGIAMLKKAGVIVHLGLLEDEIKADLEAHITKHTPNQDRR